MFPMRARIRSLDLRGFTLLEVLLTIFLLTLSFIALAGALTLTLSAGGQSENLLVGQELTREKVEEFRNTSYASIAGVSRAPVSGFPSFEREVIVTTPQTDLKSITVNVYWFDKSDEINVSLVTYASNI